MNQFRRFLFFVLILFTSAKISTIKPKLKSYYSLFGLVSTSAAIFVNINNFDAYAVSESSFSKIHLTYTSTDSSNSNSDSMYNNLPEIRFPPSRSPLSYVTPELMEKEMSLVSKDVFDEVKKATLPTNIGSFLAISAAETISGIVGGLSARKLAEILGDRKRDTSFTKGVTTGAFFGVRGFTRAGLRVLGFPRPVAIMASSILASIVSEEAKFISRKASETNSSNLIENNTNSSNITETLSAREILSDVSKWLIYDLLDETVPVTKGEIQQDLRYFVQGCVSAVIAFFIKEPIKNMNGNVNRNYPNNSNEDSLKSNDSYIEKFWKSGLEGGVLFLFYQKFLVLVDVLIPSDYNKNFIVDSVIEELENPN